MNLSHINCIKTTAWPNMSQNIFKVNSILGRKKITEAGLWTVLKKRTHENTWKSYKRAFVKMGGLWFEVVREKRQETIGLLLNPGEPGLNSGNLQGQTDTDKILMRCERHVDYIKHIRSSMTFFRPPQTTFPFPVLAGAVWRVLLWSFQPCPVSCPFLLASGKPSFFALLLKKSKLNFLVLN